MKRAALIVVVVLLVLSGSARSGMFDQPSCAFLWNNFNSIRVLDSFAVASTSTGVVALKYDSTTALFYVHDYVTLSTEPVTMKVVGDVLLVRSFADVVYFIDLSALPSLTLLGQADLGYQYYDLALSGDELYVAAGFGGLRHYHLSSYNSPSFVDSSLTGVHCIQVDVYGDELLVLDDYNGILRYDISGGVLGPMVDELLVPRRALCFRRRGDQLAIPLVNRDLVYWSSLAGASPAITDSIKTTAIPQEALMVDTLLVLLDTERRIMEVRSIPNFAQIMVFLPEGLPEVLDGDAYYYRDDSYLVFPSPNRGLTRYNLEDIWFDTEPREAYPRPGPVTDIAFHKNWLVAGGTRNPLEFYTITQDSRATLDTALLGLTNVARVCDAGSVLFAYYPQTNRIFAMSVSSDSINVLNQISTNRQIQDLKYVEYPYVDSLNMLLVVSLLTVDIYGVTGDWSIEWAYTARTLNDILDVMVVDSFLVISTDDRQLNAYRLFGDLSAILWWQVSTTGSLNHLTQTGPRVAHEGWPYPNVLLGFDGADMYEMEINVMGPPQVNFIATLPVPVRTSARGPNELYTVGEMGAGLIDLGFFVPQMTDFGGYAGNIIACDSSTLAVSDGSAVYLYGSQMRSPTAVDSPDDVALPDEFLLQNYPNPFNPSTRIEFSLPTAAEVDLTVYNIMGQKVITLIDCSLFPGRHTVTWDGTNDNGRAVASGIYFYRLTTPEATATRKMILLR